MNYKKMTEKEILRLQLGRLAKLSEEIEKNSSGVSMTDKTYLIGELTNSMTLIYDRLLENEKIV